MDANAEGKVDSQEKNGGHKVKITINGKEYETHRGLNTVEHLRHLGNVPVGDVFSQFINGQFVDLDDKAHIEIHGGEIFASHIKSSGSS